MFDVHFSACPVLALAVGVVSTDLPAMMGRMEVNGIERRKIEAWCFSELLGVVSSECDANLSCSEPDGGTKNLREYVAKRTISNLGCTGPLRGSNIRCFGTPSIAPPLFRLRHTTMGSSIFRFAPQ